MTSSSTSIKLATIAAMFAIICALGIMIKGVNQPIALLGGIVTLIWQSLFIDNCQKAKSVKLRRKTKVMLNLYAACQVVFAGWLGLFFFDSDFGCSGCESAAIVFYFGAFLIALFLFVVQIIGLIRLRRDVAPEDLI